MTELEYCLDTLYKSKSNFRWAFYMLKPDQRSALAAVYSFAHRIDSCVDNIQEKDVALKQLQFWIEELDTIFKDHKKPLHPISKALFHFHQINPWPESPFYQLIDGMLYDVHHNSITSQATLDTYCYKVASTIGELIFHVIDPMRDNLKEISYEAGLYMQKINILRDIGEDLRRGRIYIPQTLLQNLNISESLDNLKQEDLQRLYVLFSKQIHSHAQEISRLTRKQKLPIFINIILLIYRRIHIEIASHTHQILTHKVRLGGVSLLKIIKGLICHTILKSPLLEQE